MDAGHLRQMREFIAQARQMLRQRPHPDTLVARRKSSSRFRMPMTRGAVAYVREIEAPEE
jgi:hypothetical protein